MSSVLPPEPASAISATSPTGQRRGGDGGAYRDAAGHIHIKPRFEIEGSSLTLGGCILVSLVGIYLSLDLVRVFLGAFFVKSGGSYKDIATYVAAQIAAQTFMFLVLARWLTAGGSLASCLKVSLGMLGVFFTLLALTADQVPVSPWGFGLLHGVCTGVFWVAFNHLTIQGFAPGARGKLFASMPIVAASCGVLGRPAQGWLMGHGFGIEGSFLVMALVFLVSGVLLYLLMGVDRRPAYAYDLPLFFKGAVQELGIRKGLISFSLLGWTIFGPIDFFLATFLYKKLSSELAVGFITAFLPAVDISVSYLMGRSGLALRRRLLIMAITLSSLGACALAITQEVGFVVMFMVIWSISTPIIMISSFTLSAAVTDTSVLARQRVFEYISSREIVLGMQRMISLSLAVWASSVFSEQVLVSSLLIVVAIAILIQGLYLLAVQPHALTSRS